MIVETFYKDRPALKIYNDEKVPMECSVCFPKVQKEAKFRFEGDVVKYLGVWMNPGDLNGLYSLAVEPCTALYDSPEAADKEGKGSFIKPYGKAEFIIKLSVGELKNV